MITTCKDPRFLAGALPIVVIVGCLVFGSAVVATLSCSKTFSSSVRVKIHFPSANDQARNSLQQAATPFYLQTECAVIGSDAILREALKLLGQGPQSGLSPGMNVASLRSSLDMHAVTESSLVDICAHSKNASDAARIAKAVAEVYCRKHQEHTNAVAATRVGILNPAVPPATARTPNLWLKVAWKALGSVLLGFAAALAFKACFRRTPANEPPAYFWSVFATTLSLILGLTVLHDVADLPVAAAAALLLALFAGAIAEWTAFLRHHYALVRCVFPSVTVAVFAISSIPTLLNALFPLRLYSATASLWVGLSPTNAAATLPQGPLGIYNLRFLKTECESFKSDQFLAAVTARLSPRNGLPNSNLASRASIAKLQNWTSASFVPGTSVIQLRAISDRPDEAVSNVNFLAALYRDQTSTAGSNSPVVAPPRVVVLQNAIESTRFGPPKTYFICSALDSLLYAGTAAAGAGAVMFTRKKRQWRWLLPGLVLVAVASALFLGLAKTMAGPSGRYCSPSRIRVVLRPKSSSTLDSPTAVTDLYEPGMLTEECGVITSGIFLSEVLKKLPSGTFVPEATDQLRSTSVKPLSGEVDAELRSCKTDILRRRISAHPVNGTSLLEIRVRGGSTSEAATIANLVARTYCDYRPLHPELAGFPVRPISAQVVNLAQTHTDNSGPDLTNAVVNTFGWLAAFSAGAIPCHIVYVVYRRMKRRSKR